MNKCQFACISINLFKIKIEIISATEPFSRPIDYLNNIILIIVGFRNRELRLKHFENEIILFIAKTN